MTVDTSAHRSATARRRGLRGRPRRLLRATHVAASGGWLGLVVAMLVLGTTAATAATAATAEAGASPEAAHGLMALIGGTVIPPLAVATLLTGLALSLLTPWGLVRHWWVVAKTVLGLAVIVSAVTLTDGWLQQATSSTEPAGDPGGRLVAASVAHLAMLAFATVISVDKPWGRTPYGRDRGSARS